MLSSLHRNNLVLNSVTIPNKNHIPMNSEQLQEMVHWLNQQIAHLNDAIKEAHQTNNLGREVQYEGMRDAFMRCLNKLNNV